MTGTILNVGAIAAGAVVGLAARRPPSDPTQLAWKIIVGVLTIYVGLSTTWHSLEGPFSHGAKQLGIALLALILGNLTGKLLRFQHSLNRLGRLARERLAAVKPEAPRKIDDAIMVCTILFCASPVGVLGVVLDGLDGNWQILGIKALLDGLACLSFVVVLGWGVILSVLPVLAWQGSLTLLFMALRPHLNPAMIDSIGVTGGLIAFSIALVAFEVKKVTLADYLPSLVWAPLLTWLWL